MKTTTCLRAWALALASALLLPTAAPALSISISSAFGLVDDNGPLDKDPRLGYILADMPVIGVPFFDLADPPPQWLNLRAEATASGNGLVVSQKGTFINTSLRPQGFSLLTEVSFSLDIETPKDGSIFAFLHATLTDLNAFGFPRSRGADATVRTMVDVFQPQTVSVSDSIPSGILLVGGDEELRAFERIPGVLTAPTGKLSLFTIASVGPQSSLTFHSTFDGGLAVPEHESSFVLLLLGSAACAFLRWGARNARRDARRTEKEPQCEQGLGARAPSVRVCVPCCNTAPA